MLAAGAAAGMVTSLFTDLIVVQLLVAIPTSLGMLALVRPAWSPSSTPVPSSGSDHGKLVGTQGTVTRTSPRWRRARSSSPARCGPRSRTTRP